MATPARFTNGVSTVGKTDVLGDYGLPDPTAWHTYFNDFDTYAAGDWTVTETQAGATQALTDADGGALLITNTGTENDLVGMQLVPESFTFEAGKKLIFKARVTLGEATQSDFVIGLHVTDTSPVASAPSDGVYFRKDDGDTNWDFEVRASSAQVGGASAVATASTTAVELAFAYDGASSISYYVDGTKIGDIDGTPPTTELALSFAIQAGEAAVDTLTVDYVFATKER